MRWIYEGLDGLRLALLRRRWPARIINRVSVLCAAAYRNRREDKTYAD